jgi:hypothetical protein
MTTTPRPAALAIPRLIMHLEKAADVLNGARVLDPNLSVALAAWLRDEAQSASRSLDAITSASAGPDLEPGVAYQNPERALAILAGNHRHALAVASVVLGRDVNVNTWTISEVLDRSPP